MSKTHPTLTSFGYAFSGLKTALKDEPNIRIHFIIALLAVVLAFFLKFNSLEWIILVFTIALVLIIELINTSLESLVDMVSPEIKDEARVAKNVSAAAVLVAALLSVIVAGFLFLPKVF